MIGTFAVVAGLLLSSARVSSGQDSNTGSKLEVHLNYSGSGTVDEKHKIYVVLWDSPDFVKGGGERMPSAVQAASSKDGTVTFDGVTKSQVFVSAAYDPSGQWDAQSSPPEGTVLGLYSKTPGQPEPVELKPGKTTKIDFTFDDSVKMKGGKPTPQ
jgi:hypothetical protein